jgi:hypothetical protein
MAQPKKRGKKVPPKDLLTAVAAALGAIKALGQELDAIKRLLLLQLIASGVNASDIAKTLGIDNPAMSHLIPVRKLAVSKRKDWQAVPERLDKLIKLTRPKKAYSSRETRRPSTLRNR